MRRAFISLYIIIVAAIVIIGWGLDRIWATYQPEPSINAYQQSVLSMLEQQLLPLEPAQRDAELQRLNRQLALEISSYRLKDLSSSTLASDIEAGHPVLLNDARHHQRLYQRVGETDTVLGIAYNTPPAQRHGAYTALIALFYLSLAVVVFVWVWPLSRDLYALQRQTTQVGKDSATATVSLRRNSHVQPLADAFNAMANRVRELLAARKEMTYAVSHEIRTPLARMKFALEMAENSGDDTLVRRQLAGVRDDVAALERFVNELLSYASFDASEQSLDWEDGDFGEFAQALLEEIKAERPEISFSVQCLSSNGRVRCDWPLMERVISNLLNNASRHARQQVTLTLAGDDTQYQVTVEDDGPGIAESDTDKVFASFVRLDTEGNNARGYGLGLAIVRRIMSWHGGSVSVTRGEELGGARFELRWPR